MRCPTWQCQRPSFSAGAPRCASETTVSLFCILFFFFLLPRARDNGLPIFFSTEQCRALLPIGSIFGFDFWLQCSKIFEARKQAFDLDKRQSSDSFVERSRVEPALKRAEVVLRFSTLVFQFTRNVNEIQHLEATKSKISSSSERCTTLLGILLVDTGFKTVSETGHSSRPHPPYAPLN